MTVVAGGPAPADRLGGHRAPGDVVRVTVVSDTRRADLVLPAAVPVADLLPELARAVGRLDVATVHGGYRLVGHDGRVLSADSGLGAQDVVDGAVLTVAAGVDDEVPPLQDDPAEAMGEAVARDVVGWEPAAAQRAGLLVVAVFLLLGVCCLALRRDGDDGLVGLQVSGVLVAAAVLCSRVVRDTGAAVTFSLLGCAYAGTASAAGSSSPATALVLGGVALLLAGVVSCLGLVEGRVLLLTPVLVGATALGAGVAVRVTAGDPRVVLSVVLVAVVLAGQGLPGSALLLAQARGRHAWSPDGLAPRQVAADARIAHQLLLAGSAAAGAIVVVLAPAAVTLGIPGALTALLACLLVVMRAGRHRARRRVEIDLGSGVLGLVATTLAALRLHPEWPLAVTGALVVTGLVGSRIALAGPGSAARRLAITTEAVCVVAIVPVLTLGTGLLALAAG